MGQGLSFPPGVHIVVVGGGYAGNTLCAGLLDHHANFTLIDARDFFHHNVASVRSIVIPGKLCNAAILFSPIIKYAHVMSFMSYYLIFININVMGIYSYG